MFSKLEFLIAFRYLKSKQKEGFISVIAIFSLIGIMIGVGTLIVVMSVMNGFRLELMDKILGMNSHLTIKSENGKLENYEDLIAKLQGVAHVKYIHPVIESQAMMIYKNINKGVLVKGMRMEDLKHKKLVVREKGDEKDGNDYAFIGKVMHEELFDNREDEGRIKIIVPESNTTILGSIPRIKSYKIGGIFESEMYEYDSIIIFIPIEMARIHFQYAENQVGFLEIMLDDIAFVDEVKWKIFDILKKENLPDLGIMDWQQANLSFVNALKIERNVMFLILTLMILIAAFNIISGMIMLVNDKKKNIALLRAMGMSKYSVIRIFFISGSIIGVVGTFLGLIIGVLFASNIKSIKSLIENVFDVELFDGTIYFLTNLPSVILASDVILIVGMSLGLSFLATLYPALKASKTNPASILKYE